MVLKPRGEVEWVHIGNALPCYCAAFSVLFFPTRLSCFTLNQMSYINHCLHDIFPSGHFVLCRCPFSFSWFRCKLVKKSMFSLIYLFCFCNLSYKKKHIHPSISYTVCPHWGHRLEKNRMQFFSTLFCKSQYLFSLFSSRSKTALAFTL